MDSIAGRMKGTEGDGRMLGVWDLEYGRGYGHAYPLGAWHGCWDMRGCLTSGMRKDPVVDMVEAMLVGLPGMGVGSIIESMSANWKCSSEVGFISARLA